MADEETKSIGASRKEAIKQGLSRYYGRPCGHGHGTVRYTIGCHCVICVDLGNKKRRTKYGPRRRELERLRYAKNPERHINKVKAYYVDNCEVIKEKQKQRYYVNSEDEEFRNKACERSLQWRLDNPERAARNAKVSKHKRRALEQNAEGSFTADDVAAILKAQKGKCAYCRKKVGRNYHVDHIVALVNGGPNVRSNLQITCPKCNLSKRDSDPIHYARKLGKLL